MLLHRTSGGLGAIFNSADFIAPLLGDIRLSRGVGSPTFTRATVAAQFDQESLYHSCLSGEARFEGMRRVRNVLPTTSEDFSNAVWSKTTMAVTSGITDPLGGTSAYTVTATGANSLIRNNPGGMTAAGNVCVSAFWVRRRTGTGTVQMYAGSTGAVTFVPSSSWQRISVSSTGVDATYRCGFLIAVSGDELDIWRGQGEDVTGQSNQNPSEYVSVGVLASPFQGAGVDGVQYFTYLNGNTVASNVVTEATGAAIADATLRGYRSENAATQLVTPTASIRDMTDPSWVKVTMTTAKTSTGIDGVASSCTRCTASAGNATILQTLVAAASSRTYSCYIKRVTGTGTINITQDGGVGWTDITAQINSSTFTRVQLNQSALNAAFGIRIVTNTDAIDVDFNQFEAGEIATSPMATAGAVRNADVLTYTFAGNMDATKGTIYSEAQWDTATARVGAREMLTTGATTAGIPHGFVTSGAATSQRFSDGTNVVSAAGLSSVGTAIRKDAVAFSGIAISQTRDGAAVQSGTFDGGLDSTSIVVGNVAAGTSGLYGTIRNVRIWQNDLGAGAIIGITTP